MYPEDRILVAIMNNPADFERVRDWGWYRIPQRHAPASTAESDYLAFYFTKAFGAERWAIHWYAPIRGHELLLRRDLLPDQADHPRANQVYYKLQLGPLERLEPPIISLRWRRIIFIETTWDRFQMAREINDLYASGADGLFVTLKEHNIIAEREHPIQEQGVAYVVDLAIPCRHGMLTISLDERPAPPGALRLFSNQPLSQAVAQIQQAIAQMGGVQKPTDRKD